MRIRRAAGKAGGRSARPGARLQILAQHPSCCCRAPPDGLHRNRV